MSIGALITQERVRRGLSLRHLAGLTGLNTGTLWGIEHSTRSPRRAHLLLIMECLGLDEDTQDDWLVSCGYACRQCGRLYLGEKAEACS